MLEGNLILIIFYLIYLAAVFAAGAFLLKIFRLDFENKVEKKIYEFALGNVIYSYIFIYLGIFHLLYKPILFLFYIIPAIFFILRLVKKNSRQIFTLVVKKIFSKLKCSTEEWFIALVTIFILFPLVPHLFLFPASWDPLAYHLMLPKFYLQNHSFPFVDWFKQTAFPIGIEALFGYGEVVGDPRISNLMVFTFLIATVVFVLYGLRYLFSWNVLLLSTFLFLFRPILYSQVSTTPFVDFSFAFYGLVTAITMIKFIRFPSLNLLMLLVSLGAFSVMVKYSGLLLMIALFSTLLVYSIFNPKETKKIFKIQPLLNIKLVFIFVTVLPVFYWLLRNYINAGNPVFPFLNNIFKGLDYDEASYKLTMAATRDPSFSFNSIRRFWGTVDNFDRPEDYLNLSKFLFFVNLILFSVVGLFRKKQFIKYCALFGLLFVVPVNLIAGFPAERFSLPATPILLLITSFIFFELINKLGGFKLLLVGLFILNVVIQMDSSFYHRERFYLNFSKKHWLGSFRYSTAIKRLDLQDNYAAINYVNKNLNKKKDKVLAVFDNRLYYFNIPVMFTLSSPKGLFINSETKTEEEIFWKIKKMGITYVFVNNNWGIPENLRKDLYYPFLEKYLEPVFSASGTVLYKVK